MTYSISYSTQEDNLELIDLFNKYPVSSSLSYTLDRSPDYFSFCNLHDDWKVIVAREQNLTGAITITFSKVFLEEKIENVAYISDLRVDTAARGSGLGDKLMQEGLKACQQPQGKDIPVFSCVLKDNATGLKKFSNLERDNLAHFRKVAEIITYFFLPFAVKKISSKVKNYSVRSATKEDLPEMLALWSESNSKKNLAPAFNQEDFEFWLDKATGLTISSYFLAVDPNNKIRSFLGVWNQSAIRRVIITAETTLLKFIRNTLKLLRPLSGLTNFPSPGQALNFYNVVNLCIPEAEAETLPLLLLHAFKKVKANDALFLAMALDKKDPLNKQVKGMFASTSELILLSNYNFNNISTHNKELYHLEISMG